MYQAAASEEIASKYQVSWQMPHPSSGIFLSFVSLDYLPPFIGSQTYEMKIYDENKFAEYKKVNVCFVFSFINQPNFCQVGRCEYKMNKTARAIKTRKIKIRNNFQYKAEQTGEDTAAAVSPLFTISYYHPGVSKKLDLLRLFKLKF